MLRYKAKLAESADVNGDTTWTTVQEMSAPRTVVHVAPLEARRGVLRDDPADAAIFSSTLEYGLLITRL